MDGPLTRRLFDDPGGRMDGPLTQKKKQKCVNFHAIFFFGWGHVRDFTLISLSAGGGGDWCGMNFCSWIE